MASNPAAVAYQNGFQQSNYLSAGSNELALMAADAAAAAAGGAVIVNLTNTVLTANRTLTAKQVMVVPGSIITTGSFNLSGNFMADLNRQIFDNNGSGVITIPTGKCSVNWFGAGQASPTLDTNAFKRAAASMRPVLGVAQMMGTTYYINDTIPCAIYGTRGCVGFEGVSEVATIISTTLTGTTPVFSYKGNNETYASLGIRRAWIYPSNEGGVGARNSGTAIQVSGVELMVFEDVRITNFSQGVYGFNETSGQFTEQISLDRVFLEQCDVGLYLNKTSGDASFRGWKGRVILGTSVGQAGFVTALGTFCFNHDIVVDGTGFGTGNPVLFNFLGDVGYGNFNWLLEQQSTGPLVASLGAGRTFASQVFCNVQGGVSDLGGNLGIRPGLNYGVGVGAAGSYSPREIAANATFALPRSNGGQFTIRTRTGGTAVASCDALFGIEIITDPNSILQIIDGGPGSDGWFVEYVGSLVTFTNRYATEQFADVNWSFVS